MGRSEVMEKKNSKYQTRDYIEKLEKYK